MRPSRVPEFRAPGTSARRIQECGSLGNGSREVEMRDRWKKMCGVAEGKDYHWDPTCKDYLQVARRGVGVPTDRRLMTSIALRPPGCPSPGPSPLVPRGEGRIRSRSGKRRRQ